MAQYYLDTSIWRDYYENRTDNLRPLGEWALELFKMIRDNKDKIICSDIVISELSNYFSKEEVKKILQIAQDKNLLEMKESQPEQVQEAMKLSRALNIPRGDCLHAILARDNKAILVARDNHFEQLRTIVDIKKPEELI